MFIKKLLYKTLSLRGYLRVVSSLYFVALRSGVLRLLWCGTARSEGLGGEAARSGALKGGAARGGRQFDYPYFLPSIIGRGDTVIDIGANLGYYAVPMARIIGPEGYLYAVEPVAVIREVLERNLRRVSGRQRGAGNMTVYPYALGAENKEIMMGNDSLSRQKYLGTGVNMVLDENTGVEHATMEFPTQMRRGSELFGRLSRLDFIKCDIEGYEGVVIREMMPVIEAHHPTILMETGEPLRAEMVELLAGVGYKPYVLKGRRLQALAEGDGEDILFVHGSREEKFKPYII